MSSHQPLNAPVSKTVVAAFAITALGSGLSGIALFVSMETTFAGVMLLGAALSARTVARIGASMVAPRLLRAFGLRGVLLGSQFLGFLSLAVLGAGFARHNIVLAALGVMLTGLPTTLYSVAASVLYRRELESSDAFRRISSIHRAIIGFSMIVAGIAAPLLLLRWGFSTVLLLDAGTYALATLLLLATPLPRTDESDVPMSDSGAHATFGDKAVIAFALQATAALLLVALVPLVAGSSTIHVGDGLSALLRPYLWVLEGIAMFVGTAAYGLLRKHPQLRRLEALVLLNAVFLLPVLFDARPWVSVPCMLLVSVSAHLGFAKVRDDLVLAATSPATRARYSASVHFFENATQTLSPLVLSVLFLKLPFPTAVVAVFGTQLVLVLVARGTRRAS